MHTKTEQCEQYGITTHYSFSYQCIATYVHYSIVFIYRIAGNVGGH